VTPVELSVIFLLCGSWLVFPDKAYAYLDPGTGSYIVQILIGTLISALFTVKLFWARIKKMGAGLFIMRRNARK
jgi:hypothetical protein